MSSVTAMTTSNAPAAAILPARPRLKVSPVVLLLAGVLLLMVVPPILYLIQTSFYTTTLLGARGDFTFDYWTGLFESPLFGRAVRNTAIYAVASALLAIVLGVGQAWIVERTDTPGRRYVFLFSIVSLGIPGVLYTVAWILIFGNSGPVNEALMWLTSSKEPVFRVYSLTGMIIIEAINWAPLAFLLTSSVFRSADASFEEASMMSGASIPRTFRDITLKLALPAVLAVALLIVIRAFESYEIPALVGMPGNVFVLTTEITTDYQTSIPPNHGRAGAFSMGLLAIVMVLLHFYGRLSRRAERYQTITGKGYRPRPIHLGRLRYLTAGFLILFFFTIIVLPVGILIWMSLMPYIQHVSIAGLKLLTLNNYRTVLGTVSFMGAVWNTLLLGIGTATLTSLFTVLCAWFVVRRYRGSWLIDQLITIPLVFPAIVLGVAMLELFLQMPFPIYGTLLSIIYASWIRYMPYGMRYAFAGIIQIHTELEQASAISGAGQFTTFMRIVLPLVAPALTTGWLFVFLLSVGSLSLPILLIGPHSRVISVVLYDVWESGGVIEVAALGLLWTALMTLVAAAFYIIAKRFGLTVR